MRKQQWDKYFVIYIPMANWNTMKMSKTSFSCLMQRWQIQWPDLMKMARTARKPVLPARIPPQATCRAGAYSARARRICASADVQVLFFGPNEVIISGRQSYSARSERSRRLPALRGSRPARAARRCTPAETGTVRHLQLAGSLAARNPADAASVCTISFYGAVPPLRHRLLLSLYKFPLLLLLILKMKMQLGPSWIMRSVSF